MENNHKLIVSQPDYGTLSSYLSSLFKAYIFFSGALGISLGIVRVIKIETFSNFFEDVIFNGFIPGLFFLAFICSLDIIYKTKVYLKYKVVSYSVRQKRVLSLKTSYKDAFTVLYNILDSNPKIIIESFNTQDLHLVAKTKKSYRSIGEIIKIEVERISDSESRIILSCKPAMPFTLVDCCKNFETIEMIVAEIKNHIEKP